MYSLYFRKKYKNLYKTYSLPKSIAEMRTSDVDKLVSFIALYTCTIDPFPKGKNIIELVKTLVGA